MKKNTKSYQKLFKAALAASVATSAMVVLAPVNSDAAPATFPDLLSSSDHYQPVLNLTARGIIKGFPDGTFKPNRSVTRGQAAKIIALVTELDTKNVTDPGFTDVSKNDEYYGAIAALAKKGILIGYKEDNTFRPNEKLTRGQMSKIITMAFDFAEAAKYDNKFTDVSQQNGYKGFIQTLISHKITNGTTATTFSPIAHVTRGQLASFVVRAEKVVVEEEVVTPVTPEEPIVTPEVPVEPETPIVTPEVPVEPEEPIVTPEVPVTPVTPTVSAIIEKYKSVLLDLESQANVKINELVGLAKTEYATKKANGESIEISYFYSKYMGVATVLEASADSAFNVILANVEKDLIANGYDKSQAQSLKAEYEALKESRRNSIIAQVIGN